jgi:T-complex protein 1 subunit zeta
LTKDGNVLLHEMQIQHPTATMIARAATAQDDEVGDGTTSNVLFIGELLRVAERLTHEGLHPRVIAEGYELAREQSLKLLDEFKQTKVVDGALLQQVAKTSLCTKLAPELANQLVTIVVDAVGCIRVEGEQIDLHMVEIMHMVHKMSAATRLIKGLVMDHGGRHPDMPKKLAKVYILAANVSLEYEKTEVHSAFYFSSPEQRERLVASERALCDQKCQAIIDFKNKTCEGTDNTFLLVNLKGIDPICLDMLAKAGIMALRRAKRRNMERLTLACGGKSVNEVTDLTVEDLGYADDVYEQELGDDKYTFIEGCRNPKSCTVLIKGPNEHTIAMIKDAVRDGLRSVMNTYNDGGVIPGAGAFEIFLHNKLMAFSDTVAGKAKLGVQAFADSILIIPRVLAQNSGYDALDALLMMQDEFKKTGVPVGLNVTDLGIISPESQGIYDNYVVKKQLLSVAPTLAQQLILCDEVIFISPKINRF